MYVGTHIGLSFYAQELSICMYACMYGRICVCMYSNTSNCNQKLWWKNHGHDHFIIFSITAYQMVGIGVKVFFMQICQNCSTITIETSPTRTAIKGDKEARSYLYVMYVCMYELCVYACVCNVCMYELGRCICMYELCVFEMYACVCNVCMHWTYVLYVWA